MHNQKKKLTRPLYLNKHDSLSTRLFYHKILFSILEPTESLLWKENRLTPICVSKP